MPAAVDLDPWRFIDDMEFSMEGGGAGRGGGGGDDVDEFNRLSVSALAINASRSAARDETKLFTFRLS